ncbi:MAG TPA: protein kinase [Bacteroidales bacterium]|jgi:serine/threonine protein kinase|nr:protein kinase [Bacteroidales bacterium]HRS18955.1 protein kinase [Bacteroidales bacterium]
MILYGSNGTYEYNENIQSEKNEGSLFVSFKGIHKELNRVVVIRKMQEPADSISHNHFEIIHTFLTQIHSIDEGICQVLDVCLYDGHLYIVRLYVEGISLQKLLFTPDFPQYRNSYFMLQIMLQTLSIIEKVHSCGIIHHSICPQHIFIESNEIGKIDMMHPSIKLVAFEYALLHFHSVIPFQKPPVVPTYSAPEVVLKYNNLISPASDLYSLGICLYECFTRKPAFDTENKDLLLHTQVSYPLKKTWNVPQELFTIIQKATYKHVFRKPPARYTGSELEQFLKVACSKRYLQASHMKNDIEAFFKTMAVTNKKTIAQTVSQFFRKR